MAAKMNFRVSLVGDAFLHLSGKESTETEELSWTAAPTFHQHLPQNQGWKVPKFSHFWGYKKATETIWMIQGDHARCRGSAFTLFSYGNYCCPEMRAESLQLL